MKKNTPIKKYILTILLCLILPSLEGAQINKPNKEELEKLFYDIQMNNIEMVEKSLLKWDIDISSVYYPDSNNQKTILHYALELYSLEFLKSIYNHGINVNGMVNINVADKHWNTLFHYLAACDPRENKIKEQIKIIDFLICHECDINSINKDGKKPLDYAISNLYTLSQNYYHWGFPIYRNQFELCQKLVLHGAYCTNSNGTSKYFFEFSCKINKVKGCNKRIILSKIKDQPPYKIVKCEGPDSLCFPGYYTFWISTQKVAQYSYLYRKIIEKLVSEKPFLIKNNLKKETLEKKIFKAVCKDYKKQIFKSFTEKSLLNFPNALYAIILMYLFGTTQ